MPLIRTIALLEALKTRLCTYPLNEGGDVLDGRLFELVAYYESNQLEKALRDLMANQHQRVCILVPSGHGYSNVRDREKNRLRKDVRLDVLVADRAYDAASRAALVGAATNVGVVTMVDRIVDDLLTTPIPGFADVLFEPEDAAPLTLAEKPTDPGRLCWALSLVTRAGGTLVAVP